VEGAAPLLPTGRWVCCCYTNTAYEKDENTPLSEPALERLLIPSVSTSF